jgi:hypothetical protein
VSRSITKTIRWTRAEWALVRRAAKVAKSTPSDVVRRIVIDAIKALGQHAVPKAIDPGQF